MSKLGNISWLRDKIYGDASNEIEENYSNDLWNMLENEDITIKSLYVEDISKFLEDKEFQLFVDTGEISFLHKVANTSEDMEDTINNLIDRIKNGEKLEYSLEEYKEFWKEIKFGIFLSDEPISDEAAEKSFKDRYFPEADKDFEVEKVFNKVIRYIYGG